MFELWKIRIRESQLYIYISSSSRGSRFKKFRYIDSHFLYHILISLFYSLSFIEKKKQTQKNIKRYYTTTTISILKMVDQDTRDSWNILITTIQLITWCYCDSLLLLQEDETSKKVIIMIIYFFYLFFHKNFGQI